MTRESAFQHESPQSVTIGTIPLLTEDKDFADGFERGYDNYHTYHRRSEVIETSTLFFLLRNGWNADHSEMWTTGYIMGWLAGLYEQEDGQLALCMPVTEHHDEVSCRARNH